MPNRLLREGILTSERVAMLGWAEESFYRRLMSVVDDFGCYYANPTLLRAACYPLQLDKVSDADIGKWLACVQKAALVSVYPAPDGKRYLKLLDFRQQVRAAKSKFPQPSSDAQQPISDANQMRSRCVADAQQPISDAHLVGVEDEDDKEPPNPQAAEAASSGKPDMAADLLDYLNAKAGKRFRPVRASLDPIRARLRQSTPDEIRAVIDDRVSAWGADAGMAKYLRPETLFRASKFEGYLGNLGGESGANGRLTPWAGAV